MSIVRSPLPITAFGASWVLLASCSGSNPDEPGVIVAAGGTIVVAQGGATSSGNGGVMSTGGMRVTDSAGLGGSGVGGSGFGGTTGGASPSNGGSSTTGGAAPTGGNSVTLGGAANGGVATNGGSEQTGGARLTGGTSNNGGSSNGGTAASGGTATGGIPSSGGSASCTDTPRSSESCADAKAWGFCSQTWFAGSCQATCGQCSGGQGGTTSRGGATSTGGAANGGAANGGAATGGIATGGAATGGAATGGAATGGAATGGAATGGAATGGAATGGAATGGSSGGTSVPPLTNGKSGRTTRYWDCCKPSCGWKANAQAAGKSSPASSCGKDGASSVGADTQSVCSGGTAYQCNWGAPWQVGATLSYGFAAFNGTNCGKCYQLDFNGTGDNPGAQSLKGKTMIVQAINIGDIGADHFDLLIPGGGVGANNGCYGSGSQYQWGNVNGGAQSGGFLTTCGTNMTCITDMCAAAFGSNASLMAGCQWFVGWFAGANNPGISYAEVACPAEITNKSGLK